MNEQELRRELRLAQRDVINAAKPFLRVWESSPDLREPETRLDEVRAMFDAAGDAAMRRLRRVVVRLRRASGQPGFAALARSVRESQAAASSLGGATDPRWTVVLAILTRAHAQIPYAPLIEFGRLSQVEFGPHHPAAIASLAEVQQATGERRARLALAAWKDVAEGPYRECVFGLVNVQRVAAGKSRPSGDSLGGVIDLARHHGDADLRALIDFDAALFRNAHAHVHYRVLARDDALVVWGRHAPERRIATDELVRRLELAAQFCLSTVPAAMQHYFQFECLAGSGLVDAFLANCSELFGKDRERSGPALDAILAVLQREIEPLDRLLKGLVPPPLAGAA